MNKRERLALIKELVTSHPMERQEELVAALKEGGVVATQATVSRDIKELGITKVPTATGGYIYGLPQKGRGARQSGHVRSVEAMGQMIQIELTPGTTAVFKKQLQDQFQKDLFSVIADDSSILVVVRDIAVVSQLTDIVKTW